MTWRSSCVVSDVPSPPARISEVRVYATFLARIEDGAAGTVVVAMRVPGDNVVYLSVVSGENLCAPGFDRVEYLDSPQSYVSFVRYLREDESVTIHGSSGGAL